jgi:hypothetical protein
MTPAAFLAAVIRPGLAWIGGPQDSPAAARMLLAIALHESGLEHRVQVGRDGKKLPHLARGYWQFEPAGVRAAISHPSNEWLRAKLPELGYAGAAAKDLHHAVAHSELLMVLLARGLLWPDRARLADAEETERAYRIYDGCWRPGAKRPAAWPGCWSKAVAEVPA